VPEAWREDWQEAEIPAERKGPSAGAGEIMEIPMEQIIEPTTDVRRWIPQEHIDSQDQRPLQAHRQRNRHVAWQVEGLGDSIPQGEHLAGGRQGCREGRDHRL